MTKAAGKSNSFEQCVLEFLGEHKELAQIDGPAKELFRHWFAGEVVDSERMDLDGVVFVAGNYLWAAFTFTRGNPCVLREFQFLYETFHWVSGSDDYQFNSPAEAAAWLCIELLTTGEKQL